MSQAAVALAMVMTGGRQALELVLDQDVQPGWLRCPERQGGLPHAQRLFFWLPLTHSERMEYQRLCLAKVASTPGLEDCIAFANSQLVVAEQFGRFPHRNAAKGRNAALGRNAMLRERERVFVCTDAVRQLPVTSISYRTSTPEELAWLASDELPGWARSQAPPPQG
ncbi:hypothetical protein JKP88DRAFT_288920 [Tribonema minus]|uniref:Uncharacterized protein n=1 Tax=Tribonema minus TaxID=303371 RepID=A0A835ZBH5_9STRA|nr:hypothetical protein JKP88DRAFT_288920 [Tribonema minus]